MKIQKSNNNKGHGYGIVFPDWLAYLTFIGLITLLSGFSFSVIVAIRLIGIPLEYNTWALVFGLDCFIVLTFMACERYEYWKLEREWKKRTEENNNENTK